MRDLPFTCLIAGHDIRAVSWKTLVSRTPAGEPVGGYDFFSTGRECRRCGRRSARRVRLVAASLQTREVENG